MSPLRGPLHRDLIAISVFGELGDNPGRLGLKCTSIIMEAVLFKLGPNQ